MVYIRLYSYPRLKVKNLLDELKDRRFLVIWFIEIWERYAFYGFQSLFLIFITSEGIDEERGYLIFGIFNSLLYLTPTIGGFMVDRYIGAKKSLLIGAIILMIGYGSLSLFNNMNTIMWSLSCIIVGNGLFKPSPSALISKMFTKKKNLNSAFTIFYMSINIGSFVGIIVSPIIANKMGFSLAFGSSVLGIFLALCNYKIRFSCLKEINTSMDGKKLNYYLKYKISLIIIAQLILFFLLFQIPDISFYLIIFTCIGIFLYMLIDSLNMKSRIGRISQILGILLIAEAILYFTVYNQMFSTLILFAKHNLVLKIFNFDVLPSTFTSMNAFWLILISPILASIYARKKKNNSSIAFKFSIGTIISGISFIFLRLVIIYTGQDGFIDGNWMIVFYFFSAISELLISALGFSLVATYFRKDIVGLGMGFFMLSMSTGGAISGKLGKYVAVTGFGDLQPIESMNTYSDYFFALGIVCLFLGVIYWIFAAYIKKWTDLIENNND